MDGVLVKQTGREGFDTMPWADGGHDIWNALSAKAITLLSRVPDRRLAAGYREKRIWVDRELGKSVPLIVTPDSLGKAVYCLPDDVLIDDGQENCLKWQAVGGRAILHFRVEETILIIEKMS